MVLLLLLLQSSAVASPFREAFLAEKSQRYGDRFSVRDGGLIGLRWLRKISIVFSTFSARKSSLSKGR